MPTFAQSHNGWARFFRNKRFSLFFPLMSIYIQKTKSDTYPFKRYLRSKNTQIWLASIMSEADLLQIDALRLFVLLPSVYTKKIKFRHQSVQEILKIKEYSNLIGWEHGRGRLIKLHQTNPIYSLSILHINSHIWLAEIIFDHNLTH